MKGKGDANLFLDAEPADYTTKQAMIPKRGGNNGATERRPRACYNLSGWY